MGAPLTQIPIEDPPLSDHVDADDVSLLMNEDELGVSLDATNVPEPNAPAPEVESTAAPTQSAQEEPSMEEPAAPEPQPTDVVEQPAVEPAPEVVPEDEVAQLKAQITAMQQELERVSGAAVQAKQQTAPAPEVGKTFATATEWIKDESELQGFGVDVKATNSILDKVRNATREETVQAVLQNIPAYVIPIVQRAQNIERAINQFWAAKPHLRPYTQYVSSVTAEVQAEHPEWEASGEYHKIFAEAATRVEARIPGLAKQGSVPSAPMQTVVQQPQRPGPTPVVLSRPSTRAIAQQKDEADVEFDIMDRMP